MFPSRILFPSLLSGVLAATPRRVEVGRRRAVLFLLGAGLAATLSCGGGSPHSVEEKYFLVATNIKLPYWQAAASGLYRSAAQLQVKAEMAGPDTYDPQAQREEFRRVLTKKPTGILISVADPELMNAEIDAALAQGILVLTMDSDARASKRLTFVGTDNYKAGVMGGDLVASQLKGKGNVVVYTMPEQDNLKERLHGYQSVFGTHPQIKIVETVNVKGDPRVAFDRTTEIVDKGALKADAFVCLEATACAEIAEVLGRKKIEGKVVMAMDTDQRTLEWIQKGVISATIGQKPFTMAAFGLRMLDSLHHYKPASLNVHYSRDLQAPVPSFVDTGSMLVDKSNVSSFLK